MRLRKEKRIVIILKKIVWIIILLLLTGCNQKNQVKSISSVTVHRELEKETYLIVDVRTKEEYEEGHIQTAVNIPVNKIEKIKEIVSDKKQKIVVYCRSGARSKKAAEEILKLGYTEVYDMKGINNWTYGLEKE